MNMRRRWFIQGCTWSATTCPEFKYYWEGRFHVKILTTINRIRKWRSGSDGPRQEPRGEGPPAHIYMFVSRYLLLRRVYNEGIWGAGQQWVPNSPKETEITTPFTELWKGSFPNHFHVGHLLMLSMRLCHFKTDTLIVWLCAWHRTRVEVRGKFPRISALFYHMDPRDQTQFVVLTTSTLFWAIMLGLYFIFLNLARTLKSISQCINGPSPAILKVTALNKK